MTPRLALRAAVLWLILLLCVLGTAAIAQQKRTVAERLGYPPESRLLIIHADDYGMLHSVNRATSEALTNHWISSASILVPCPWFPEAAQFARSHPELDLGIHVALNSEWTTVRWRPVSPQAAGSSLLDKDGYLPLEETEVQQRAKPQDAEVEARAQIEKARAAGIRITHLDAHMKAITLTPDLLSIYFRLGEAYRVPELLVGHQGVGKLPDSASLVDGEVQMEPGIPLNQWLAWYKKQLSALPAGVYQLTVHLGIDDDELRAATADHPDWGAVWRQHDYDMVKSPEFRQFLRDQHFILVSWRELARALTSAPEK
jgi:chitin disaccharide deacetylase